MDSYTDLQLLTLDKIPQVHVSTMLVTIIFVIFLNQVRTWFLEITLMHTSVCVCVCLYVRPPGY